MKRIIICAAFVLLFSSTAFAADCPGTPSACYTGTATAGVDTLAAINCSWDAVSTTIAATTTGDTVTVPAGTCSWTSTVSWTNKNLTVTGAGSADPGGTILNVTGARAFESKVSSQNENLSKISGFHLNVDYSGYEAIFMQGQGWRVHNNSVENVSAGSLYSVYASGASTVTGVQPYGLVDANYFRNSRVYVMFNTTLSAQNTAWADASPLGTGNAVYFENNTFYRTDSSGVFIDSNYAAKWVFRYNTCTGGHQVQAHALQGASQRGTRSWEVYNNSFTSPLGQLMLIRGGTGVIYDNYVTNASGSYYIAFDNVRSFQTGCCGSNPPPATDDSGMCDGTSLWDENTADQSGWPCRDQIGRGADTGTDSSVIGKATSSQPAYVWNNKRNGAATIPVSITNETGAWIVDGRDYFYSETDKPAGASAYSAYTCPHPLADPTAAGSCTTTAGTAGYSLTDTLYAVSAVGTNVTVSPASQSTTAAAVTVTATPAYGYTASCSGCSGSLSGTTYTTGGSHVADCTVTCTGLGKRAVLGTIDKILLEDNTALLLETDAKWLSEASSVLNVTIGAGGTGTLSN